MSAVAEEVQSRTERKNGFLEFLSQNQYDFIRIGYSERKLGEEKVFEIVLKIARILRGEFGWRDKKVLTAALLLYVAEESSLTLFEVRTIFGNEVAEIINQSKRLLDESREDFVFRLAKAHPTVLELAAAEILYRLRTETARNLEQDDKARDIIRAGELKYGPQPDGRFNRIIVSHLNSILEKKK